MEFLNNANFNPHSHEGSDTFRYFRPGFQTISIHTPTKGATFHSQYRYADMRFQSTLPRRERRDRSYYRSNSNHKFQSTLPRRERRSPALDTLTIAIFQSTLPRRERLLRHNRRQLFY